MEPSKRKLYPSPQTEANCLSKLTFWWSNNVFQLGFQRHLEDVDIYDVLPEDSSIKLSNDLGREWEKELYKWRTGGQPSLFKALFRCYGPWIIAIGFVFLIEEGFRISQAIFLGLLVSYFEPDSEVTWLEAYLYSLGWAASYILVIIFDNLAFHKSFYFGLKMRVACTSLIYRKLLKLSQYSLHEMSTGNIVSLMSTDAHRFDQSCLGINYIWIGPLEAVVILTLLWQQLSLGPCSLIGVGVIFIMTPIQFFMGRFLSRLRLQMSQLADRRVRIMSEIISGMKTIKMNCWEKPFSTLINAVRSSEWMYLRAMCHCRGMNSAMYFTSGKLVMFSTFTLYILTGHTVGASVIFTSLALYEILRASVSLLLPWGVQYFREALAAIHRIQAFLLLEERNMLEWSSQSTLGRPPLPENVVLKFEDYTASWNKDERSATLEGINLTIQKGQMLSIVGPMDSGKSSLLMAILNEIPRIGGFIRTRGKLAYVPQHNWVFAGSIRENILFGQDLDRRKYNNVLHACALLQDLESFPHGDLSIVGDKGIYLTTGQKTKICMARAAYQEADVYLIDEVLNSVDEKTAVHIFTKCFCQLLSTSTIILVTSNMQFIKPADLILILKLGKLEHSGTYEDLKNMGVDFDELLSDYGNTLDYTIQKIESSLDTDNSPVFTARGRHNNENYSSEESLESIMMEFKESGETDYLLEDEQDHIEVKAASYWGYFKHGGGALGLLTFMLFCILAQVTYILTDWWLYNWARSQKPNAGSSHPTSPSINSSDYDISITYSTARKSKLPDVNFFAYLSVTFLFIMFTFLRSSIFSFMAVRAGRKLHDRLFSIIMRAPLVFFDKHTVGQVLSRFARDIGYIDDPLPASLFDCIQFLGLVCGAVIMAGIANYWLFLVIGPLIGVFIYARFYYIRTARDIKKIEVTARNPIYQHLSHTLEGLWTIRAFQNEERFQRFFDIFQDRHTAASYMYLAVNRWFALRLDLLSVLFVALLGFVSVAVKDNIDSGLMGLALAYALNLMGLFQYSIRQTAELENQMASVERIQHFISVKPEADMVTLLRPPTGWPQYGIITFEGATLVQVPEGVKLLRNLWCCIRAEEKVGVLSRPEGSKKGFILSLLRLTEPQGVLRIDGIDITDVGLQDLREKITVIPQDPLLFGGSMRRNLDPFTRFPDALLWKALAQVQLKDKVEKLPGKMYAELFEFGNHFSLGERQLLCLARAMLRSSKILIIEEPVSIIDKRMEAIISHIVKTRFSHCTVIYLAHKINTVIDMDRVMMLDEGRVKEFDPPHLLLQHKHGHFYKQFHQLPNNDIKQLKAIAKDKYENKPYQAPPQSLGGELAMPVQNRGPRGFLPSFQTNRLSGVLNHFSGNRFSTNRF